MTSSSLVASVSLGVLLPAGRLDRRNAARPDARRLKSFRPLFEATPCEQPEHVTWAAIRAEDRCGAARRISVHSRGKRKRTSVERVSAERFKL